MSAHMMQRPRTSKGKAPGKGKLSDPESKGKGKEKRNLNGTDPLLLRRLGRVITGRSPAMAAIFVTDFISTTLYVLVNGKLCRQKHRAYDHGKTKN